MQFFFLSSLVKDSIKQIKHMMCISLTIWTTTRDRAQMVCQPILIVGQLMEAYVPHSAARKFSRGDALYSSLRRGAMQSLVLFDICVVFSRAMGVALLSFHDTKTNKKSILKKIGKKSLTLSRSGQKSPYGCVKLTVQITIHKKKSHIVGIKAKRQIK